MNIQVIMKNVYGVDKIYPVCDKAKLFARMVGQKTLTQTEIEIIKQLGYVIEIVHQERKL